MRAWQVGWLHHLLRHVVACFLTRGQLWISWEAGRDVFDKLLLDAGDVHICLYWLYALRCSYNPAEKEIHFLLAWKVGSGHVPHTV